MAGTGKPLEREFARGLRLFSESHPGLWWQRWPDYHDFRGSMTKYVPPKAPADFVALYNGHMYALECKSTKSPRFNMEWVRGHQLDSLSAIKRCGGVSALVFSTRSKSRAKTRCFFIDIDDYLHLEREYRNAGYASIPIDEIMRAGIELPRVMCILGDTKTKQGAWDLTPMFEPGVAFYIEEKPSVKRKGRFGA